MKSILVSIVLSLLLQTGYGSTSTRTDCREGEVPTVNGDCQTVTNAGLTTLGAPTTAPDYSLTEPHEGLPTAAESPRVAPTTPPDYSQTDYRPTTMFLQPQSPDGSTAYTVKHSSTYSTTALLLDTLKATTLSQQTIPSITTTTTSAPIATPFYTTKPEYYFTTLPFITTTLPVAQTIGGNSLNEWFEEDYNPCPPGFKFFPSLGCQKIHNGGTNFWTTPPWSTPRLPSGQPTPPWTTQSVPQTTRLTESEKEFQELTPATTSNPQPDNSQHHTKPSATHYPPPSSPQTVLPATISSPSEVQTQESSSSSGGIQSASSSLPGISDNTDDDGFKLPEDSDISNISEQNQVISNCPHLLLDDSKFLVFQNGSVFLEGTGILNEEDFHLLASGMLKVCVSALEIVNERKPTFNRKDATVVLTNLCLVSSQVFLLVTFILHCCFHELRNLPGLNLMFLSISLLMAHAIFFFGSAKVANKIDCKIIGVFLHYFWLSAFAWLNICSFHTFRVFWFIFTSRNLETKWKVIILKYCLIGFGMPSVVVTSFILGNYFQSGGTSIGYSDGSSLCFSSPGLNRYLGLLLPAGLTVLVSLILFILTLTALCRATSSIRRSNKPDTWAIIRYIKLSSITGFSWIFGFLQLADKNNQVFPYIYIILTGFQGVFIFLAFMVNRRVYTIVTRRCRGGRGSPADKYSKSTSEFDATASIK